MPEFMQLETPMEVIKYIEKEKEYGNICHHILSSQQELGEKFLINISVDFSDF